MTEAARLPRVWAVRSFLSRPPEFVLETRERFGDVSYVNVGHLALWFFHHPDAVEEILVTRAKVLHKDLVTRQLEHSIGRGLLTTDGDEWKRRRRLAAPTLTRRQIQEYADDMVRYAVEAADEMARGDDERDVHHDMMALTLRVVARTLFATEIASEVQTVGDAMEGVMEHWALELNTWRRFVPPAVPLPNRVRVQDHLGTLDATIMRLIRERRADAAHGDDLMSRLIRANEAEGGTTLSDQHLLDEAKTFFAAGHETTAIAITMALYFASEHAEVAARLDEELERVLAGRAPTLEDVDALVWTDAVVRETMRLHPPAWVVGREGASDVEIAGHVVPAGAQMLVSPFAIHRDPRWWPRATSFCPERWLEDDPDRPRFAYLPFGAGPRICIGNHFAMLESVLLVATLWQRLRFRARPWVKVRRLAAITMRPADGMPMRVTARASA